MSDSPSGKVVKLVWESDEDFQFVLGTNLLVNFDDEHFYIRFYQATPPAVLDGEIPNTVKAKLVAGVAIPATRMRGIAEGLLQNYQMYTERERKDADFGLDYLDSEGNDNEQ
jgi:hypothetical protein